jgi:hypothetical protein
VARLARRKQLLALAGLLAAAVGATVVLAGGLLAGKSAVDPSFSPPFFSTEASSTVRFGQAEVVRGGHTTLGDYLRSVGQDDIGLSHGDLAEEGLVFRARLQVVGHRRDKQTIVWSLRHARTGRPLDVPTYAATSVIRPTTDDETRTVKVWIGTPRRTGRYVVDFELHNARGRVVEHSKSEPFTVLANDFFVPYRSPSYRARLPRGWKFVSRYTPTSGRFVTKVEGPRDVSVLIDTTRNVVGDPADSAKKLHDFSKGQPDYRLLKLQPAILGPNKVYEWSFEEHGRLKTDIFFYEGGDGFAVLAEGPRGRFAQLRAVAREVASSVRPIGGS